MLLELREELKAKWRAKAECRGLVDDSPFFPGPGQSQKKAVAHCRRCEVKIECREFALGNEERYGIWGGLNDLQRTNLRAKRNAFTNASETLTAAQTQHKDNKQAMSQAVSSLERLQSKEAALLKDNKGTGHLRDLLASAQQQLTDARLTFEQSGNMLDIAETELEVAQSELAEAEAHADYITRPLDEDELDAAQSNGATHSTKDDEATAGKD